MKKLKSTLAKLPGGIRTRASAHLRIPVSGAEFRHWCLGVASMLAPSDESGEEMRTRQKGAHHKKDGAVMTSSL